MPGDVGTGQPATPVLMQVNAARPAEPAYESLSVYGFVSGFIVLDGTSRGRRRLGHVAVRSKEPVWSVVVNGVVKEVFVLERDHAVAFGGTYFPSSVPKTTLDRERLVALTLLMCRPWRRVEETWVDVIVPAEGAEVRGMLGSWASMCSWMEHVSAPAERTRAALLFEYGRLKSAAEASRAEKERLESAAPTELGVGRAGSGGERGDDAEGGLFDDSDGDDGGPEGPEGAAARRYARLNGGVGVATAQAVCEEAAVLARGAGDDRGRTACRQQCRQHCCQWGAWRRACRGGSRCRCRT